MIGNLKILKTIFTVAAIISVSIIYSGCKEKDKIVYVEKEVTPTTEIGAYYTNDYSLPHTQSAAQLAMFMASNHFEYDLDGWFFFGSLDMKSTQDTGAFFIAIQRIEMEKNGFKAPMVPAIIGFNSRKLGHYECRGLYTVDIAPLMVVTSSPWSVTLSSPLQEDPLMKMELISGIMGAADAVYRFTANIPDKKGNTIKVDVQVRDRMGAVNQGYGTASFFPQYITTDQRNKILASPIRSVAAYLEATKDPMSCQGSFYYSLPLIDVEQFSILQDSTSLASGTGGCFWMDYVVQSYDARAQQVFATASWDFYAIQLPEINAALLVMEIRSATGTLPIATLFRNDSGRTLNYARKAVHSWALDEIKIEAVPGTTWKSSATQLSYVMQHRVRFESATFSGDLLIKMARENQEIVIPMDSTSTIKYQGLGTVEGTLGGQSVKGFVWLEMQPTGHL